MTTAALAADAPGPAGLERQQAEQELRRRQAQLDRLNERLRQCQKELEGIGDLPAGPELAAEDRGEAAVLVRSDVDRHGRTVYTLEASGATLKTVLDHIAAAAETELILDNDVPLRAIGHPVLVALEGVMLRDLLDLLLGRFDLDYSLGDDGIVVTPPAKGPFRTPEERLAHKAELAYQAALVKFPDSKDAPQAHLILGQHFHARKLFPQAIEELRRLLAEYPNCEQAAAALYTMAQSYEALGDGEQSVAAYRALVAAHPRSPLADDALLAMARAFTAVGRAAEAIPLLEEITTRYLDGSARFEAELALGECLMATKRFDAALGRFERLLRENLPEATERRLSLSVGRALMAQGNYAKARTTFLGLKAKFPGTPEAVEAYYQIAETYFLQGDYLSAIEAYQGALKEAPTSPRAEPGRLRLAELYRETALFDAAIAAYEQVLADNPGTASRRAVLEALGECYWAKGNLQKAQLHFERAAADSGGASPATASPAWRALCRAGQAALADRRPADALPILQRVVEEAPDRAVVAAASSALGDCYRELGRLEDALVAYRNASKALDSNGGKASP